MCAEKGPPASEAASTRMTVEKRGCCDRNKLMEWVALISGLETSRRWAEWQSLDSGKAPGTVVPQNLPIQRQETKFLSQPWWIRFVTISAREELVQS